MTASPRLKIPTAGMLGALRWIYVVATIAAMPLAYAQPAPYLVNTVLPEAVYAEKYSAAIQVGGDPAPVSVTVSGLPTGLTSAYTGGVLSLSGTTLATPGNYVMGIVATNASGTSNLSIGVTVTGYRTLSASAVAAGAEHSCAIVDGGVKCWGNNAYGQLGNGTQISSRFPVQAIPPGSGATVVAAGGYHFSDEGSHSCAVVAGGVQCWGAAFNNDGQLGNGAMYRSIVPVQAIAPGSGATHVSVGQRHSCAVVAGGVQCWGRNIDMELGNLANFQSPDRRSAVPIEAIPAGSGATFVSAGFEHSCAVVNAGVQCWGENGFGELGNNSTTNSPTPVQTIPANSGATAVSAAYWHSCALVSGGVQCWGLNNSGQLGNNSSFWSLVPAVTIASGSGAVSISTASNSSCAVVMGGMRCWGNGALGSETVFSSQVPLQVIPAGSNVTAVSGSSRHSCILVGGLVKCWGSNTVGQLGRQANEWNLQPTPFVGAGGNNSALARGGPECTISNGGVKCWGDNTDGLLGNGTTTPSLTAVTTIAEGSGATMVAGSIYHRCAVVSGGVRCWGANFTTGLVGNGSTSPSLTPVQVLPAGSGVTSIAAGPTHSCAIANGGLWCWGSNGYGQFGKGDTTPSPTPVKTIADGSGLVDVAVGDNYTCAVIAGGVQCWGRNHFGQLGNGTKINGVNPVQAIPPGSNATAISTTYLHACAVVAGGVRCWGHNASGQLGNGSQFDSSSPVQAVPAGSGATAVAVGADASLVTGDRYVSDSNTCAIVGGGVQCWGGNHFGQLGNGSQVDSFVPVQSLPATSGVVSISIRRGNACGILAGVPQCWGFTMRHEPSPNAIPRTVQIPRAASTTTLESNLTPAVVGGSITFTAHVAGVTPVGTVRFLSNAATIAGCEASGVIGGIATCTTSFPVPDTYAIAAEYGGDGNNEPSNGLLQGGQRVDATGIAVTAVVSRKIHAGFGACNVTIDRSKPLSGAVSIEPRHSLTGHAVIFQFDQPISTPGAVSVVDALGAGVGSPTVSYGGNEIQIRLDGIPNSSRVKITLGGVNGSFNLSVALGFLVGDVGGTGLVSASDIARVKANVAAPIDLANCTLDLNLSGAIDSADVPVAKANSGRKLTQ